MAYIGQGIKEGTFSVLDTSGNTYNGSNVTFSLGLWDWCFYVPNIAYCNIYVNRNMSLYKKILERFCDITKSNDMLIF